MSVEVRLSAAAITVESSAIALLFLKSTETSLLLSYFTLHAVASALMAPVVWHAMPSHYREPKAWVLGLLFSLCFFIPVLGLLGFFATALITNWLPFLRRSKAFQSVTKPIYRPGRRPEELLLRTGRVRQQLMSRESPLELRMRALLALQNMPGRHASGVLREALGDSADDLRLLAYGMLESKEKELTWRIQEAQERFQRYDPRSHAEEHYNAARELAELYWELVYQNLVQGDMRSYALAQVQRFSTDALRFHVRDAGLWVMSGRMRMMGGDYNGAAAAFSSAIALGFPAVRAEPYLAELAYLRRDYSTARRLMRRIRAEGRMPQLRQAASFWS